jgi:hypothetical protein
LAKSLSASVPASAREGERSIRAKSRSRMSSTRYVQSVWSLGSPGICCRSPVPTPQRAKMMRATVPRIRIHRKMRLRLGDRGLVSVAKCSRIARPGQAVPGARSHVKNSVHRAFMATRRPPCEMRCSRDSTGSVIVSMGQGATWIAH